MQYYINVDGAMRYSMETLEEAEEKVSKMRSKGKITIKKVPNIKPGLLIYRDSKLHSIVAKEAGSIFLLRMLGPGCGDILSPFDKERLKQAIISGYYTEIGQYLSPEEALEKFNVVLSSKIGIVPEDDIEGILDVI